MTRLTLFRLVAIALLLVTGAELFACEIFEPQFCESFGSSGSTNDAPAGDKCLCCCAHVVVIAPLAISPIEEGISVLFPLEPPKPQCKSFSIYHPPKF